MSESTQKDAKPRCRCGCGGEAEFIFSGFEFDPTRPDRKGKPFDEPCCRTSAEYLAESSVDLGFPWSKKRI